MKRLFVLREKQRCTLMNCSWMWQRDAKAEADSGTSAIKDQVQSLQQLVRHLREQQDGAQKQHQEVCRQLQDEHQNALKTISQQQQQLVQQHTSQISRLEKELANSEVCGKMQQGRAAHAIPVRMLVHMC